MYMSSPWIRDVPCTLLQHPIARLLFDAGLWDQLRRWDRNVHPALGHVPRHYSASVPSHLHAVLEPVDAKQLGRSVCFHLGARSLLHFTRPRNCHEITLVFLAELYTGTRRPSEAAAAVAVTVRHPPLPTLSAPRTSPRPMAISSAPTWSGPPA